MVGPLTIKQGRKTYELLLLTMIDPATGWFELKDLSNQTAKACEKAFDDTWLSRYPRPQKIGFDNGKEYKATFAQMCKNMGIKAKKSLKYNPQSNGIVERVHQVIGDMLRTFELEDQELDPEDPFGGFLTVVGYAIRSTYHTTLEASPAQLVFGRDMMFPIQFQADWAGIQQRRQNEINRNNERENKSRIQHIYKPGDTVTLKKPGIQRKMSTPRTGPYKVTEISTNGTIRIQNSEGNVTERVNIRRVHPYNTRGSKFQKNTDRTG